MLLRIGLKLFPVIKPLVRLIIKPIKLCLLVVVIIGGPVKVDKVREQWITINFGS